MRKASQTPLGVLLVTVLGALLCSPSTFLKVEARTQLLAQVAQLSGAVAVPMLLDPAYRTAVAHGDSGASATQLNLFQPKEPIVVDARSAYPSVWNLPGEEFRPISNAAASLIGQLEHSSDGIVRLPPGDYSIPVRLY